MQFSYYYDTRPTVPYLFISDLAQDKVEQLFQQFIKEGVPPSKLMIAQYPANDGKKYEFLIRFPFDANGKRPDASTIDTVIKNWLRLLEHRETLNTEPKKAEDVSEIEKVQKKLNDLLSANDGLNISIQKLSAQLEETENKTRKSLGELNRRINGFGQSLNSLWTTTNRLRDSVDPEQFARLQEEVEDYKEVKAATIVLLNAHVNNADGNPNSNNGSTPNRIIEQPPRIIIIGTTEINRPEIEDIFKEKFERWGFDEPKRDEDFELFVDKDYKKSGIWHNGFQRLDKGNFDYIIAGPVPHNVKKFKGQKESWKSYLKRLELKTIAFEDMNKAFTKSHLALTLDTIAQQYKFKQLNSRK
jgi:hypothetical protein